MIPQSNPQANYLAHKAAIDAALTAVLDAGWYILGRQVAEFEREFAAWLGSPHAVGTASGTDALQLALRACGIGAGDLVLTVSHTAVATVAAIELAGATPVFVDIDPRTFTMDPACLRQVLQVSRSRRVKAVVPVHLYGHPADMPAITELASRHGLFVIEDCAQAHGASIGGRRVGTWGHLAAFSFYPTKNLGALGDAGAVSTGDAVLADKLRSLREYGWRERYVSDAPGMNTRLDELQAAVLRAKLPHLEAGNLRRGRIAALYSDLLRDTCLILPTCRDGCQHAWHQYVVRSRQRDGLRERLQAAGVTTLVHYPVPVHLQPAYEDRLKLPAPLPHTEEAARQVLSLPMFPELSDEQVAAVVAAIHTS